MFGFMGVSSSRANGPGAAGSLSAIGTTERSILFVEDVLEQRLAAVATLRAHGYRVHEAADGGQAMRLATKSAVDVIVMDLSLPVMDGIEVIRRVRALGGAKRPHIIVMSAQSDARTRQLAFEAGCDQYIVKPFGLEALASAIEAFFVKRDGH